jgi:hypothetical protein
MSVLNPEPAATDQPTALSASFDVLFVSRVPYLQGRYRVARHARAASL